MSTIRLLTEVAIAAAYIGVSLALIELISRGLQRVARRAGARGPTLRGIRDGLRLIWFAAAVSVVVAFTGLASQLTVLTISGIAGLVISLSLQAVFSNIIAGILLIRDGAIRIGDRVEYSGVKGRVARVALRNTWIVTDTGTLAIVSNSSLTSGPLINHTASQRLADEFQDWTGRSEPRDSGPGAAPNADRDHPEKG
ncbi:MAG: mechanosensitive ion channel family protein [Thermoplasmata archaeon]|nr:mechanosensitive ion channel family protein [Thermoplasmata archaeon]